MVSRRAPFLRHDSLDLIAKSGELKGFAQVIDLQDGQRPAALRYSAPGEDGHVVETEPQRTVERQADRRGKKVKRKRR